jgi:hypothetical protein
MQNENLFLNVCEVFLQLKNITGMVAHACNLSYLGCGDWEGRL